MTILKVYEYPKCSTCIRAVKFLTNARYALERINIFETPPTKEEIRKMLRYEGDARKLFNTSGHVYQEQGLSKKVPLMSEDEVVNMLSANGRLVKRPFVLWDDKGLVGYDLERWKKVFH